MFISFLVKYGRLHFIIHLNIYKRIFSESYHRLTKTNLDMQDFLDNLIDCIICGDILKVPISNLPCGHLVCKAHETEQRREEFREIYCRICHVSYPIPNGGFSVGLAVEKLLMYNYSKMQMMNKERAQEINKCIEAEKWLEKYRNLKERPEEEINELVAESKNAVDLARELRKKIIDDYALNLVDKLDKLEQECKSDKERLEKIKKNTEYENSLQMLEKMLAAWKKELNSFENNTFLCVAYREEFIKEMTKCYEKLKKYIFQDKTLGIEQYVRKFCEISQNIQPEKANKSK